MHSSAFTQLAAERAFQHALTLAAQSDLRLATQICTTPFVYGQAFFREVLRIREQLRRADLDVYSGARKAEEVPSWIRLTCTAKSATDLTGSLGSSGCNLDFIGIIMESDFISEAELQE